MTQNGFNKILLSAVDEGLRLLGDSSEQAILYHLETSFQLKKENIPFNLTEFQEALEGIFGPGATFLENIIVKRLYEKLDLNFDGGGDTDFIKSVHIAKSLTIPKRKIRQSQSSHHVSGAPQLLLEVQHVGGRSDEPVYVGQTQFSRSLTGSNKRKCTEVKKHG